MKKCGKCKCDFIIDAYEDGGYLIIQRANKSKKPGELSKDLTPMKFKI